MSSLDIILFRAGVINVIARRTKCFTDCLFICNRSFFSRIYKGLNIDTIDNIIVLIDNGLTFQILSFVLFINIFSYENNVSTAYDEQSGVSYTNHIFTRPGIL